MRTLLADKRARWVALAVTGAVVVLVLAAFIWIPRNSEEPKRPIPELTDYDRALQSLQSGEASEAADLLNAYLRVNPDDEEAADLLTRLTRENSNPTTGTGETPHGDGGGGEGEPPTDEAWLSEVSDITRLLPLAVSGLVPGSIQADDNTDAVLPFDPKGDAYPGVRRILYAVHDLKAPDLAAQYVKQTSRAGYPGDGADLEVDGADGYFGTDGDTVLTVVYVRGRYVFEILVTVDASPEEQLYPAAELASAFPDSPE